MSAEGNPRSCRHVECYKGRRPATTCLFLHSQTARLGLAAKVARIRWYHPPVQSSHKITRKKKKNGGIFTLRSVCWWHMVYISPFISNPDTTISQFIQHLRGPKGTGIKVSQNRINPDKTEVMMIVGRKYLKNVARGLLCFSYEHIFLLFPRLVLASQWIPVDVHDMTSPIHTGLFTVPNLKSVTGYFWGGSHCPISW